MHRAPPFIGWNYTLTLAGRVLATVSRQLAFGEKFVVETAAGEDDAFMLAVVLAIDNIHDERRDQHHSAPGGMIGS